MVIYRYIPYINKIFFSILTFWHFLFLMHTQQYEKQKKKKRALKKLIKENYLVQKFKIIPLCRHRQHFAGGHSLNCDDVVFADRMHRRQFVRYLWFRLDKMGNPISGNNIYLTQIAIDLWEKMKYGYFI